MANNPMYGLEETTPDGKPIKKRQQPTAETMFKNLAAMGLNVPK